MGASEMVSYIANAAASGIIGNRMDSLVTTLDPVRKLHAWLRERRIDPAALVPSPATTSWVGSLGDDDRAQLRDLLRESIGAAQDSSVQNSSGVAVGNDNYGATVGNSNYGTVIGSQNYYGTSNADSRWEYAKINYGQEGDFDHPGRLKWAAYIARPGAERLDVRDHARIEEVLNELGQEGCSLSDSNASGINTTEYLLRRPADMR